MDAKFVDRLLICSDCQGEFIFTAGEQLFFSDKQFKNDPKRCKPCKSRRSGLAGKSASGPAAAGISRTETRTECSDCGIETTVPFKPTQGRPVLCRQCFQDKGKVAAVAAGMPASSSEASASMLDLAPASTPVATLPTALSTPGVTSIPAELLEGNATATALAEISADRFGAMLAPDAAVMASNSISTALARSSVATAADLASIAGGDSESVPGLLVSAGVAVNILASQMLASQMLTGPDGQVTPEIIAAAAEAPTA
jgi:CxxC-x17-CxxC domain-containing protein